MNYAFKMMAVGVLVLGHANVVSANCENINILGNKVQCELENRSITSKSDFEICNYATRDNNWDNKYPTEIKEAKRRGLDCGVKDILKTIKASKVKMSKSSSNISFVSTDKQFSAQLDVDNGIINLTSLNRSYRSENYTKYYQQILDKVSYKNNQFQYAIKFTNHSDNNKFNSFNWVTANVELNAQTLVIKDNKLKNVFNSFSNRKYMFLGVKYGKTWYANKYEWGNNANKRMLLAQERLENKTLKFNSKNNVAIKELGKERQKRLELERKIASLLAKQKEEEQVINADIRKPTLEIIFNNTRGKRGTIKGIVKDNVKVAEVNADGQPVKVSPNGNFEYSTYVPAQGLKLKVEVTDTAGLTTSKIVALIGNLELASPSITFDRLNPLGKRVKSNPNALALIVGVSNYENTTAKALYADNDALVFKDYATEKLGVSERRIKVLLNDGAEESDILLSVKEWLRRSAKPMKSDIYVFFAGHGLASQDGNNMYLLPHDGSPRLLDDTAILRDRLFADLKDTNPKSVTVFLDTCYSGETRNEEMLIAGRPIMIKAKKQSIPSGFTLFSAASNEQISRPLEEAKHGMFSYFLMKGMEGDADSNNDNKITAQELHNYVKGNVTQQSSGSQTPELQGDKDRVLVQFN